MKFEVKKSIRAMAKAGVLAGSLLGVSMMGQSASAASGDVRVDISFPPLGILYYYDDINIATVLESGTAGCVASDGGLSCAAGSALDILDTDSADDVTGTTLTYTADIVTEAGAVTTATNLSFVLENVWAVRALIPGGAQLDASVSNAGDFTNLAITPENPDASMTLSNTAATDHVGDLSFDVDVADGLTASDTLTVTVVASL